MKIWPFFFFPSIAWTQTLLAAESLYSTSPPDRSISIASPLPSSILALPLEVVDGANTVVGQFVQPTADLQGAIVRTQKGYSFAIHAADAQLVLNQVVPVDGSAPIFFQPYRAIGYLSSDCSGQAFLLVPQAGYVVRTSVYASSYQFVFTPVGEAPAVRSFGSVLTDASSSCGRLGSPESYASVGAYPNSKFVTDYPPSGYVAPLKVRVVNAIFADGFDSATP